MEALKMKYRANIVLRCVDVKNNPQLVKSLKELGAYAAAGIRNVSVTVFDPTAHRRIAKFVEDTQNMGFGLDVIYSDVS